MSLAIFEAFIGVNVLTSLRFENIALLNTQEINFSKGFNVITGETGSGKTILLDCLDVLLGGSQSSNSLRLLSKEKDAFLIEAVFSLTKSVMSWLDKFSIEGENDELVITREWRLKENRLKSRSRVNGVHVNLKQLNELRSCLIDFTFQGSYSKLETSSQQLTLLDKVGSSELNDAKLKTKLSWEKWINSSAKLKDLEIQFNKFNKEQFQLEEFLNEIETYNLDDPNEIQVLENEQDKLANSFALKAAIEKIFFYLREGNEESLSIIDQFSICTHELKLMIKNDKGLQDKLDEALNLNDSITNFINSLYQYYLTIDSDPASLDRVQSRLNNLVKLKRRHGLELYQLIEKRDELRKTIYQNELKEQVLRLKEEEEKAKTIRDQDNSSLSILRAKVATKFESSLLQSLRPLGLLNVNFKVQIIPSEPNENGADHINFLFSANPGQPMLPLDEIASGGEMSRFLLALKSILYDLNSSKIFVFDEIDSGVSGRVSKAVAKLLKDLSLRGQVFCVTHQPIVAAVADHHFCVNKLVKNGKTFSKISYLPDRVAREKELAELAGGDNLDAQLYAASLLEQRVA